MNRVEKILTVIFTMVLSLIIIIAIITGGRF